MAGGTLCRFGGKNRAREKRGKRISRQTTPLHAFIHLFLSLNQSHSSCLFVAMETSFSLALSLVSRFIFLPPENVLSPEFENATSIIPASPPDPNLDYPYPIAPWSGRIQIIRGY